MSAEAMTWAISPPMTPAPTTAALNTNMARHPRRFGLGILPIRSAPITGTLAGMTTRTRSLAALAAGAAVLAVPAMASAAGPTVVAGPIKAKGYKLTLTAANGSLG